MKEFNYTILDALGIHARPAGQLAKKAAAYKSTVTIVKGEKEASTKRLMALMALGAKGGDTVKVRIEGEDEEKATAEIKEFLEANKY